MLPNRHHKKCHFRKLWLFKHTMKLLEHPTYPLIITTTVNINQATNHLVHRQMYQHIQYLLENKIR